MDVKARTELERAKALFYSWHLLDAYNIFRRYYDRIPFCVEQEHALYISLFTRILLELGKDFELKFYKTALEGLYQKWHTSDIGYQLAVIYSHVQEPQISKAKEILERIIQDPEAGSFQIKAKLLLAYCYDAIGEDIASCRRIIDSLNEPDDPELKLLAEIWRAKILRDEKKYHESEELLLGLLKQVTPKSNWYSYFSANLILARLYLSTGEIEKAREISTQLEQIFGMKQFRSISAKLLSLKKDIDNYCTLGRVTFQGLGAGGLLSYEKKSIRIKLRIAHEQILVLLMKRRFIGKGSIIKHAYGRAYCSNQDDPLVYYQIHSLRKLLKKIGVPPEAVKIEGDGYRFIPETRVLEGPNEEI